MFVPFALVLLRRQNQILLLKRADVKFGTGAYCMPGGKIEDNETAQQAAIREAMEEVGVSIALQDLTFAHIFHRKGASESLFALVFVVTQWQGECHNNEPTKHDDLQWFSIDQLPSNLLPAHRQAIECIQQNCRYSEHGW